MSVLKKINPVVSSRDGRYSLATLVKNAITGHKGWRKVWRNPEPRRDYDVIIVGGGGHGLATAYYLAKEHGIRNIAVLEKNVIGCGNAGRNTTIVRSDYHMHEEAPFYEYSVKLWESLSTELNFNVMFSQRGALNVFHTQAQRDFAVRQGNAMILNGIDAQILDRQQVLDLVPAIQADNSRFPVLGGLLQPRGGNARHDAMLWGYARAADNLGVDIIQNCEVTALVRGNDGRVTGVDTTRGRILAKKTGLSVAGHTSELAAMAGLRLPLESHLLQAFVTESIKPFVNTVVMFGMGHFYISQSDKGSLVFGGKLDGYNSYTQRGNLPVVEDVVEAAMLFMPSLSRLRLLRHWGGIVDMTMDGSPIMGPTDIAGLYLNGGWCYGGFKATPAAGWCFAYTIATGKPHVLNAAFQLDRFSKGRVIDAYHLGPEPGIQ